MDNITKIAIILPFEQKGGLERMATFLSTALCDWGYKVFFIMTKCKEELYEKKDNIYYEVLPHDESRGRIVRIINKVRRFRSILQENHIDTVVSFGHIATMFAVPAVIGLKIIHVATLRIDPAREPENPVMRKFRDFLYHFVDRIVFQTEDARGYFCKTIRQKGTVIPNPISEDLPERFEGVRRKEVVNFCRLTRQKNLPLLIEAFSDFYQTHKDYRLVIYGKGEEKENLISQIDRLSLDGVVSIKDFAADIHSRILDSAMFVSSSDYEGISNSMLESMAIGLPVICTDCPVGGARMFIRPNENGLLVPVGDRRMLASAMNYLADNTAAADEMGRKAMGIRRILSQERIIGMWVDVIDSYDHDKT